MMCVSYDLDRPNRSGVRCWGVLELHHRISELTPNIRTESRISHGGHAPHELERVQGQSGNQSDSHVLPSNPTHLGHVRRLHTHRQSHQRHRDRIYEATDLGQFRGKRVIVDAAGFFFWLMEDVMGKQVGACLDGWGDVNTTL